MTIEVEIRNKDAQRQITVVTVDYERGKTLGRKSAPYVVEPGLNYIAHVHALRELIISEQDPSLQGRPK